MCRSSRSRKPAELRRPVVVVACLIVGLSLGCGGSDGLTTDGGGPGGGDAGALQLFIGTWHPTTGSLTLTCAGQAQTDTNPTDTIWEKGTTSDLLQPPDSSGCTFLANASGRTAVGVPNQSCTQGMGSDSLQLTVTSYMFTVGASGTTATESGSGTAVVTTGGTAVSCTLTESASYTKTR